MSGDGVALPEILSPAEEEKFLASWMTSVLGALREAWAAEYGIGVTTGHRFTAWRLDRTGQLITAEDVGELKARIRADHESRAARPQDDPPQPRAVLVAALRWSWNGIYLVTDTGDGLLVVRADDGKALTAPDEAAARDAIIADFAKRPVIARHPGTASGPC